MMKEIYAICNSKKVHIGTVKYFSDNGEEFCLIESLFTARNACKPFLRRCEPVNTVFILPCWYPAACQTVSVC